MTYNDALVKCASLCAKTEYSKVELIGKMCRWGISRDMAKLITDRLAEENYINEERFAQTFVYDKFNLNSWVRNKIRYYLKINGIGNELIKEAIRNIDPQEYSDTLKRLLSSKFKTLTEKHPYKQKIALCRYAVSRGFETTIVTAAVNKMIAEGEEIEAPDEI